ncbi:MAG: S-layer homology domain-containing protein [Oscillospiraceae bacterium]|nr:S-layer homology domain-containing protein [Oscillospiraceae bacterium]
MKRLLACILLLSLLAVSASALEFTDAASVRHADEISVLCDLGLIRGYEDGSFRGANNIRRSEAAKLAALICEQTPRAASAVKFADVSPRHWAADYIAYCNEKGIIVGSNGRFRPEDFVTAREFAKMLLVCVGYDGAKYTGALWAQAVDADAESTGVYDGFLTDRGRMLSRDDACLLMDNAMQCYAVIGTADGKPVYALDELMNPVTYMEHRFGTVKFQGVLMANEYADLSRVGGALEKGMSKLAGHTEAALPTAYTLLGRTLEFYTRRSGADGAVRYTVIGNPSLSAGENTCVATSADDYILVLRYSGYAPRAGTEYYYNGDPTDESFLTRLGSDCTITGVDRDGDKQLDAVVVWDYITGTVQSTAPLRVTVGGVTRDAAALTDAAYKTGDAVRCLITAGGCWLP